MLTVHKYPVRFEDTFALEMPVTAKILTVQVQRNQPQMWALVDPTDYMRTRTFRLVGTGHPIKEAASVLNYIGTFQELNESLVFHLFEVLE